jgi:hypothetical protein
MQIYDILSGFEIYSMLFSLLSLVGDPVSIEDVSLTTLSVKAFVTLLLLVQPQLISGFGGECVWYHASSDHDMR